MPRRAQLCLVKNNGIEIRKEPLVPFLALNPAEKREKNTAIILQCQQELLKAFNDTVCLDEVAVFAAK